MQLSYLTGISRRSAISLSVIGFLAMVGCSGSESTSGMPGGMPAPVVKVAPIEMQSLVIESTLTGRLSASRQADVRPQVGGVITSLLFSEGTLVKAGQPLYQIDPRPYQVALSNAKAQLSQAQAALAVAEPKAKRYAVMAENEAVSRQENESAQAAVLQAKAQVQSAQAAVDLAELNLEYTQVRAPITGVVSTAFVTPGALVQANQAGVLAKVHDTALMHVDVVQSSAALLQLRKQILAGSIKPVDGKVEVDLILEDGSVYPHKGLLNVVETEVTPTTGTVRLRIQVPNPDQLLMPGAYIKAKVPEAINPQAILVHQKNLTRTPRGEPVVKLVNTQGVVEERAVTVDKAINDQWIVTDGLSPGEQLIVEGGSALRAGQAVTVSNPAK